MVMVWWWPSRPPWLGSEAVWFLMLNAVVVTVAVLSSRARASQATTPRRGDGVTRRASSVVLQSIRSCSIFSFPSACFSSFLQPDTAATIYQETDELVRSPNQPSPRALPIIPPPAPAAAEEDEDEDEEEDPNVMSMDEAYELVLASRLRPEQEQEEEARRSEVDAQAEEFIRRQALELDHLLVPFLNPKQIEPSRRSRERGRDRVELVDAVTRMMAAVWWWCPPLPAWLASSALWFLVVNAVVAAVAVLSRARPQLPSPRRGAGVTRRASSAVLQSLRSFSIFSFPSACFNTAPYPQPDAAAQETEEPATARAMTKQSLRSPPVAPSPKAERAPVADEDDDTNGMSMDEAYALALAAARRPEREREEEARRSEVDARADEFIRGFKEDLRQQRLNSIYNYTQMLKQRAFGGGRRQQEPRPDQL
ncbi:hypothetical protein BAE44_0003975 [Dichanthelium oligosanthes]|uniref:DUF4408 domain-containing protein n=1 Tax=Dichanthelium oligosanthes TaxID=888268 RepID=A0A1E5WCB5_9POAL|nr:hypothetical protein BAE44_0003975 [Dichanthelium oligosanthes]